MLFCRSFLLYFHPNIGCFALLSGKLLVLPMKLPSVSLSAWRTSRLAYCQRRFNSSAHFPAIAGDNSHHLTGQHWLFWKMSLKLICLRSGVMVLFAGTEIQIVKCPVSGILQRFSKKMSYFCTDLHRNRLRGLNPERCPG